MRMTMPKKIEMTGTPLHYLGSLRHGDPIAALEAEHRTEIKADERTRRQPTTPAERRPGSSSDTVSLASTLTARPDNVPSIVHRPLPHSLDGRAGQTFLLTEPHVRWESPA